MRACLVALMLSIVVAPLVADDAPPAPATKAGSQAEGLARKFFEATDVAERRKLAKQFAADAPGDLTTLPALLRRAYPFPEHKSDVHTFETRPEGVVPIVRYIVSVPPGYKADSPNGWPLVIGMHGTGGTGPRQLQSLARWLGKDLGKYIVACPQAPYGGAYVFNEQSVVYPRVVLNDIRRRLNVDSDRVIMAGYSKGGYTTWATSMFSPGEWAAAVPMAAFPLTDAGRNGFELYLGNVLGLNVQYHWGDRDILPGQKEGINTFGAAAAEVLKKLEAERFEPIEYKGEGHSLRIDLARLRSFMDTARRETFPTEYRHTFHHLWEGRAYHVRALRYAKTELNFKKLPQIRVSNPDQVTGALMKLYRDRAYEIRATVKPKANSMVVRVKNLREVEVALSPLQLDFTRPIRLSINGRLASKGKLDIDWYELLDTVARTGDFQRLIGARMKVTIPR
jgi:hypothetical protein